MPIYAHAHADVSAPTLIYMKILPVMTVCLCYTRCLCAAMFALDEICKDKLMQFFSRPNFKYIGAKAHPRARSYYFHQC